MNDSEKKDAAEVLERAADLLWVKGRCQGAAEKPDGSICTSKAIALAMGMPARSARSYGGDLSWIDGEASLAGIALAEHLATHPEALNAALRRIVERVEHARPCVAVWNDWTSGEGSDEHVIDTIRRCAKELRA